MHLGIKDWNNWPVYEAKRVLFKYVLFSKTFCNSENMLAKKQGKKISVRKHSLGEKFQKVLEGC